MISSIASGWQPISFFNPRKRALAALIGDVEK